MANYLNHKDWKNKPDKGNKKNINSTMHPMNCSQVHILVFSFQYYSQLNHFIWEMICSFIFSDWLMSPGCCQIRICYPKYSPQQDLPLAQKYAEWKKANPDSSWAVGKHHHGLNGKSGVECSFRKQNFFPKKVPKQLKILANQMQCCGTVLIICVPIIYVTDHNLIIFCFF